MLAATFGSMDAMMLMLDAAANVNAKNNFDAMALCAAQATQPRCASW